MARKATIRRKTTETDISVAVNLDGKGKGTIATTIPFLDHMLNLLSRHGQIDISVKSKGDTEIDDHHLAEDLGICLGEAVGKALGDKKGIGRYGSAILPMDECLCRVAMDISGRPFLVYKVPFGEKKIGSFDPSLLREFFKAFADHSGITLHVELLYGKNSHHKAEAVFKAFARALREAVRISNRREGVPSTKGSL